MSEFLMNEVGTFFVNDDMELSTFSVPKKKYEQLLINSIIRALKWLNDNILNENEEKGHFLREKIRDGIKFTPDMNRYLINSYSHWKIIINNNNSKKFNLSKNKNSEYIDILIQ